MRPIIGAEILQRKRPVALARWLLGKHLVRRFPDGREDARMIVETEAYNGEHDLACHARAGRTARTDVLYGPAGIWYVYLCYGIHDLLNIVVGPEGWPAAVLIRGIEGASGPGRVTKALSINRDFNRQPAIEKTGLWLEDRGVRVPAVVVKSAPRVGVDYAGPIWSLKPWRFILDPKALPRQRSGHRPRLSRPVREGTGAPAPGAWAEPR